MTLKNGHTEAPVPDAKNDIPAGNEISTPLWMKIGYGLLHAAMATAIIATTAFIIYVWEHASFQEGRDTAMGYGLLSFMFWLIFSPVALFYGATKGEKFRTVSARQRN